MLRTREELEGVASRAGFADCALALVLSLGMANELPFIQAACICERVLAEKDGVHTLIRVVDSFKVGRPAGVPPEVHPRITFTLFVLIRAGDVRGTHTLSLGLRHPDGLMMPADPITVELTGPDSGHTVKLDMVLEMTQVGLHWFDLGWDGKPLTSVLLKLEEEALPAKAK